MNSFEVLEVDDSRWLEILNQIGTYDIYQLPSYHRLSEIAGEGKGVMLVYKKSDLIVAFPLLLREITDIAFLEDVGKGWKDAVSVYGYGGPISSRILTEKEKFSFWRYLVEYFNDICVVSVFSTIHPLLEQKEILKGYGELAQTSSTISIDLTLNEDLQWKIYRRSYRQKIKILQEKGCICFEDSQQDYWGEFIEIYLESMKRNNCSAYYFFNQEYFNYLRDKMGRNIHLFVCLLDGKIINAGMVSLCNGIIQANLRGTREDYLTLSPEILSVDTLRKWGKEKGAHTLHLGRGYKGQEDSLLHFKKGFSKREHSYHLWRCIFNKEIYSELCKKIIHKTGIQPQGDYFPIYRDPVFLSDQA